MVERDDKLIQVVKSCLETLSATHDTGDERGFIQDHLRIFHVKEGDAISAFSYYKDMNGYRWSEGALGKRNIPQDGYNTIVLYSFTDSKQVLVDGTKGKETHASRPFVVKLADEIANQLYRFILNETG